MDDIIGFLRGNHKRNGANTLGNVYFISRLEKRKLLVLNVGFLQGFKDP